MNSTMNEPVIRKPSSGAGGGDGGDQRVAQDVQADDAAPAQALRLRGADVVLLSVSSIEPRTIRAKSVIGAWPSAIAGRIQERQPSTDQRWSVSCVDVSAI